MSRRSKVACVVAGAALVAPVAVAAWMVIWSIGKDRVLERGAR